MRGYDRGEVEEYDDYEEYEGYEQEEEEEEEGDVEEEDPKPTKEELEYLELRQRLKEQIRKQMKKESGSAHVNSNDKKKRLPFDNYGSFFGPSQSFISQRVIQESKSLLETEHLAARVSSALHSNRKSSASHSHNGPKPGGQRPPPRVNEVKTKVQKLKDTRDYSFLLSEDAQLPAPSKDSHTRNVAAPQTEARSVQVPLKSKQPLGNTGRHGHSGREERKHVSINGQMQSKSKLAPSRSSSASMASRQQIGSNGPGAGRQQLGSNGPGPGRQQLGNNGPGHGRQQPGSNGHGPGRPMGPKVPSMKPPTAMPKRTSVSSMKESMPGVHKPLPSKLQTPSLKQHVEQKKELREPTRAKMIPKQQVPSSRPEMRKPQKQVSSYPISHDHRPKRKPVRSYSDDEDDDSGKAISMIRQMFRYNPSRFSGRDEDDSDMEAGFEDIMREERRSAKIAKKEDDEQLRLIEAEEERERMLRMRKLKKRKLGE